MCPIWLPIFLSFLCCTNQDWMLQELILAWVLHHFHPVLDKIWTHDLSIVRCVCYPLDRTFAPNHLCFIQIGLLSYLAIACALFGPGDWSLKSLVDPHFLAPLMFRFDIEFDKFRGDVADEGEAAVAGLAPAPAGDMWSCWNRKSAKIVNLNVNVALLPPLH